MDTSVHKFILYLKKLTKHLTIFDKQLYLISQGAEWCFEDEDGILVFMSHSLHKQHEKAIKMF